MMRRWGCHSFEGGRLHAVFNVYYTDWLARLIIVWRAIRESGVEGLVIRDGDKGGLQRDVPNMADYGIIRRPRG